MKPTLVQLPLLVPCLLPLLCAPLGGCAASGPSEDARFVSLANHYLEARLRLDPEWATDEGDHRHDARLTGWSAAAVAERAALSHAYLDSLAELRPEKLSLEHRVDLEILQRECEGAVFEIESLQSYKHDPLVYVAGGALYDLLARDFAPLPDRLRDLAGRLREVPERLQAARANLVDPARIHVETAIEQNRGTLGLLRDDLPPLLAQAPQLEAEVAPAARQAAAALEDYGRWLSEDLLPRANGDFRLGERLYRRKLAFALGSDLSPESIQASARQDLAATQQDIYRTALPLYRRFWPDRQPDGLPPGQVVREVLDRLAESRPDNDTVVDKARACLDEATAFVRDQGLVTLPEEPIRLIVMPEYQRGVAVAYCDAPGPLERKGETFYSIAPTPADWSPERVASFFREYNDHMLKELTIHEAMPGHYLQLAHANRFHASTPVRAAFSSGTFVEGWATYAEQLMAEKGFGGPELRMQMLKMRLRLIINAILDQGIHMGQMSREEAMRLMMDEGYQEEGEAAGKWRRAQLTSAQLSTYYVGNLEINGLRRDAERAEGTAFDLRAFHDRLLACGSPPPRLARRLLGLPETDSQ